MKIALVSKFCKKFVLQNNFLDQNPHFCAPLIVLRFRYNPARLAIVFFSCPIFPSSLPFYGGGHTVFFAYLLVSKNPVSEASFS